MKDNAPFQQLSNLVLEGLSTKQDTLNTDDGRLYGTLLKTDDTYSFTLYSDLTRDNSVASGTTDSLGVLELAEENDSGLTGTINLAQYEQDDTAIEVVAFLSKDSDIPMSNLETLQDYDQDLGFAEFHIKAFNFLKDYIKGKFKSIVWNSDLIDTQLLNGKTGGYDFSRVLNFQSLREASAHFALSRIAERVYIEPGSVWDIRQKESKNLLRAHLEKNELRFDVNQDRVEDRSRVAAVWKIGRA